MRSGGSKRIALVTDEILGFTKNAGAASANTFLSFALADLGHEVEILYAAPIPAHGLAGGWRDEYDRRAIPVRGVEPPPRPVSPRTATVTYAVQETLRRDPPDVVIVDDRYGMGFASVRSRSLGLGFQKTLFAIYCHGTTAWISEAHRKVRRWPASFEVEALERAAIALADVAVSPSAYMVEWMRSRGWRLPRVVVAPLLTQAAVERRPPRRSPSADAIRRIAFFGRLEERKGLQPFLEALNGIAADHLAGVELLFLGKETPRWNVERIRAALSPSVTAALAALRFETTLDQPEAVAELETPGTLAVMPSLVDNSPMVVYECLEHGVPFLASRVGGGPELVAAEDRERSFVEPTAPALQRALTALLVAREPHRPPRAAFDADEVISAWESVVEASPPASRRATPGRAVSAIVRRRGRPDDLPRCLRALATQTRPPEQVVVAQAGDDRDVPVEPAPRELTTCAVDAALGAATGDFVVLLEDRDELEADALQTLLQAQSAGDADVVTCAVASGDSSGPLHLFLGDPGGLGLLANHYGLVALYRRSALEKLATTSHAGRDSDWLALASLSLAGCRIVSVPRQLVNSARSPGTVAGDRGVALEVVRAFERRFPPELYGLPPLAAGLAALAAETRASPSLAERARWILANEGAAGILRRARRRVGRRIRARGPFSAPAWPSGNERPDESPEPPPGRKPAASQPAGSGTRTR